MRSQSLENSYKQRGRFAALTRQAKQWPAHTRGVRERGCLHSGPAPVAPQLCCFWRKALASCRDPCRDPRLQQQLSCDGKEHPDSDRLTSREHQGCPPLGPRRARSAGPWHQTGHCLGTPAVVGGTLWENGETETPEKTQPGQCCFVDVKTLIRPKPPTSIGRSISVPHPSIRPSLRWNHPKRGKMRPQETGRPNSVSALGQIPSGLPGSGGNKTMTKLICILLAKGKHN